MPEVPITKISFPSRADFTRRLVAAFQDNGMTAIGAQILVAHVAVSTGWGRTVDNYRIAGIKADPTWRASRPYTAVVGCECRPGLPNKTDPKCVCAPGYGQEYTKMYWRAYNSLRESAADFVKLLRADRYQKSLAMAQAGDVGYFTEVGRAGWYTADPAKMQQYGEAALKEVQGYLGSEPVATTGGLVPWAIAAVLAWWLIA